MKKAKKILLVLLSLIIILGLSIYGYLMYTKPKYEGELQLKNISEETTVYFDEFGVPHIYANSQKDAMVALGYVHAQDRLWQMELLRRIAPGKLAEIFGTKALKTDTFFASLGIDGASEKAISELDKNTESYQLANAYLQGINQYIDKGQTPIEFRLLGLKKRNFEIKDVYNIFGFMSFSFAMAQKTDPLLTDIRDKFGMDYLKDFGINSEYNFTKLKDFEGKSQEYSQISKSITSLLEASEVPTFIGSNSWIIGEQKTKNGKVIFANDPHIAFSQPATWYEAHIVSPDYEMYGYHLAGTPFPLLGHNRQYAYGLTMFENDDVDFYKETNNPLNANEYQTPNGFQKFVIRKKTIKVKDSSDVVLNLKISRHGPIINNVLDGMHQKNPVAMSWIYTQQPIKILDATFALCHAKNVDDFRKNISLIASPGLNIMYGDAKGNIAWTTSGKLYKHDKNVNTNFILDGASGKDEIKEFLDFSKNPKAINPSWNYLYSANNQPEAIDGFLYPGYYLPEDRAKRINTLLAPKNNWIKADVSKMILDNQSSTALETVKNLLSEVNYGSLSLNEKKAFDLLKSWKATNSSEEIAPTIFNKWVFVYLKNTFKDEMGADDFKMFLTTHIMKQIIAAQLKNENSPWWDDISTKNSKESKKQIIAKSFHEAISNLEKQLGTNTDSWTWGKVHTLEHQHPMGKVAALRKFFNVGPFQDSGSNEVINNQIFPYSENGEYNVTAGPSTRRIIDFSDIENSWSILPTGQSGNPMSKHYNDQAEMYNAGKFRKMKLNKQEIIKTSTKLVFNPKI
jgi:penicillin G amidase